MFNFQDGMIDNFVIIIEKRTLSISVNSLIISKIIRLILFKTWSAELSTQEII